MQGLVAQIGGFELEQAAGELQCAKGGTVGDGDALTSHPVALLQHGVKHLQIGFELGRLRVPIFGELRLLQRGQARMAVADAIGSAQQNRPFHAPIGHLDKSALGAVLAHQIGLGKQAFQVSANRPRFGQHPAIVQLQRRHFG